MFVFVLVWLCLLALHLSTHRSNDRRPVQTRSASHEHVPRACRNHNRLDHIHKAMLFNDTLDKIPAVAPLADCSRIARQYHGNVHHSESVLLLAHFLVFEMQFGAAHHEHHSRRHPSEQAAAMRATKSYPWFPTM
jgi:hypothetical protein